MERYRKRPGEGKRGYGFYEPATKGTREFRYVAVDTNTMKSFVHDGFLAAPGDPGALTLFGNEKTRHALFAAHIAAADASERTMLVTRLVVCGSIGASVAPGLIC